jgi:hypothetical protein
VRLLSANGGGLSEPVLPGDDALSLSSTLRLLAVARRPSGDFRSPRGDKLRIVSSVDDGTEPGSAFSSPHIAPMAPMSSLEAASWQQLNHESTAVPCTDCKSLLREWRNGDGVLRTNKFNSVGVSSSLAFHALSLFAGSLHIMASPDASIKFVSP